MSANKTQAFLDAYFSVPYTVDPIAGGGSDRIYSRVRTDTGSFILTESENLKENESFFYFSEVLKEQSTPKILSISEDKTLYLQSDLGQDNLLDFVRENPNKKEVIYAETIKQLVSFQNHAHSAIDYNRCFAFPEFSHLLVLRDLFYFKHYFLDVLPIPYSQYALLNEFETFSNRFANDPVQGFCYRDFQGRNIMVYKGKAFFIDYQGGMQGPPIYDLVSLTWQAKAQLAHPLREGLKKLYFQAFQEKNDFSTAQLQNSYDQCVLERLLQVLGAYGKLGLLQGKQHFKESITFGIQNLSTIQNTRLLDDFPELRKVIQEICSAKIQRFIHKKLNS